MSEEIARSSMLPAISWLTSLSEEERELFSTYGNKISVEPENAIIREGEPQPNFYFILQGTLSVKRGKGGDESVVGVVSAGESLGEMTMVTRGLNTIFANAQKRKQPFQKIFTSMQVEFMRSSLPAQEGKRLVCAFPKSCLLQNCASTLGHCNCACK